MSQKIYLNMVPWEKRNLLEGKLVYIRTDYGPFEAPCLKRQTVLKEENLWKAPWDRNPNLGRKIIQPGAIVLLIDLQRTTVVNPKTRRECDAAIILHEECFHQFYVNDLVVDDTCSSYDLVLSLIDYENYLHNDDQH